MCVIIHDHKEAESISSHLRQLGFDVKVCLAIKLLGHGTLSQRSAIIDNSARSGACINAVLYCPWVLRCLLMTNLVL